MHFWGLQPNDSGEGRSRGGEMGLPWSGVMRSEFRRGSGSRMRTEGKIEPRRAGGGPLLSLSLGEGGYATHLDAASLPVKQREGSLAGHQAQEAGEACPGQRAPLLSQLLLLVPRGSTGQVNPACTHTEAHCHHTASCAQSFLLLMPPPGMCGYLLVSTPLSCVLPLPLSPGHTHTHTFSGSHPTIHQLMSQVM